MRINNCKQGFSIIEALLAGAILMLLITAVIGAVIYGEDSVVSSGDRARAVFLAEEGIEALRNIKDAGFQNLTDGTWGLATSTNIWSLAGASNNIERFNRSLQISTPNANTKTVTSTVTWAANMARNASVVMAARFTNWSAKAWSLPQRIANVDFSGAQGGTKIAVQGNYAYIIRAGGTPNFAVVNISNPAVPLIAGTAVITGIPSGISVSGNFAYVSSDANNAELQIVNVTNPNAPVIAGNYDAPSTSDGTGVYASGTTAFLLRANGSTNEFLIVNVAVPTSGTIIGSLNLGDGARDIWVSGNFAYIATEYNKTKQFMIVNITNPASPILAGSLVFATNLDSLAVTGFGTTAIVGQGTTLRVINVSNPAAPVLLGSLDLGGTVNDLAMYSIDNSLVFAGTSNSTADFQVINIGNPGTPLLWSSLDLTGVASGVAYQSIQDRVYVADASSTAELMVIAPQ